MHPRAPAADEPRGTYPQRYVRWDEEVADELAAAFGAAEGRQVAAAYHQAFPPGYRNDSPVRQAVEDIAIMQGRPVRCGLGRIYRAPQQPPGWVRLRICWPDAAPLLQEVLPIFAGLGLRVADHRSYEVHPADRPPARVDDFGLLHDLDELTDTSARLVEDAFAAMWTGRAERDGFNRLVLTAGLPWRQAALVRAAYHYLWQAGFTFSRTYVEATLAGRPRFVRALLEFFAQRFDPDRDRGPAPAALEETLQEVTGLDEDKTLRAVLAFVQSMVRTNYYQRLPDGANKDYFAFKIDPSSMPFVPRPRPLFETFVYSPRVAALHLRAERVARGGIRWSDRPEDFRTEVLGLMKAQAVKNALIVPGGAKGAFVLRRSLAGLDRAAIEAEVRECYATFIRGMLDITDNRVDTAVVPPPRVVRHDEADPYLVVAADKGTARLSDVANAIACEYGFWLGDAFASGGSAGYDHKAMGITARGAWVSLRQHFEDCGRDPERAEFTVVGIGDMSGDVFGNGMLLSPHIRLLAAFDHRHIFLDPDPDPALSHAERTRLAGLPASSWQDYDRSRISPGGGVFSRRAKSVPLSPQVRRMLAVDVEAMTPPELVQALLRAPVDLLWNGGVGTFVKASTQTHPDAADPANDAIRVDATQLRASVVVEGGNLGLTQPARIEYALRGGRINTDFIDNAAGVDTSDREVNLKILLNTAITEGMINRGERDELLAAVQDEVAAAVLTDSRLQARILGVVEAEAPVFLDQHAQSIRRFEQRHNLDRELECLPDDEVLAQRRDAGLGLARPEIAVLLAHAKNHLARELSNSPVPDDPYLVEELLHYLPRALRERFGQTMARHPLRREILSTALSNDIADHVGSGFFYRLEDTTGVRPADAVRAYLAARDIFGLNSLWSEVDGLAADCPPRVRTEMFHDLQRFCQLGTLWFLRHRRPPVDIAVEVEHFRKQIRQLAPVLPAALAGSQADAVARRTDELTGHGVPGLLASRIAALGPLAAALDAVEIAGDRRDVGFVAAVYSALDVGLRMDWLQEQIVELRSESHWELLAKISLRDDLFAQRRRLTSAALARFVPGVSAAELVEDWLLANTGPVDRCRETLDQLRGAGRLDVAMLSVALQDLRNLAQISADPRPV
ncbi:NAD-glutamate dehydrogenase [Saccharopolyspora sp. K220]|uniref:NAD-glutamate dehydrogenase domain-containing protein n=1 Tax=Saccharopolyspora soli TaxID=2926618 RepID=UPI001F59F773|nr:NAD-glutamate dehydrogenase domain-containing protein [Saccharopolyspora soli]MCI2417202.1 NAD-glutamate dehydrogenase [Saccharopolyspora soli]